MPNLTTIKDEKNMPLAIIRGGNRDGEMVYFDEREREGALKIENLYDYIPDKEIRKQKKYMTTKEMLFLKDAFENNHIRDEVKSIYDNLKPTMDKEISKHIHINNGSFEIIPLIKENQVQKCFISGQSGSGKSTWISNYAQTYKKLFPNNSIYVISRHNEDPVLDKIKGIKRLELDEEILEAEIDIEDFKDSLIILDDIETISDKKINKLITNLRDDLLQNCRHHNIYLCCVSHSILNYGYTRSLILESDLIVFFPRSGGYQIKRYLKEYQGYNKEQINIIMRMPSRWVCINKNTYPPTVISENDIYIL